MTSTRNHGGNLDELSFAGGLGYTFSSPDNHISANWRPCELETKKKITTRVKRLSPVISKTPRVLAAGTSSPVLQ